MVLDIIIITGVAAAMLGWNVHVMRENGVRRSPIFKLRRPRCDLHVAATAYM